MKIVKVNLVSWDNGVGLSRDLALLGAALPDAAGFRVAYTRRGRGTWRKLARPLKIALQTAWKALARIGGAAPFDCNIELEHIWPEYFPWARRTLFVPNPEWCGPRDVAALSRIGGVLAKTRTALALFEALGCRTVYIGFTSPDRIDRAVPRQKAFFHLAGRSRNKGTDALVALWRKHPEWPTLTVVQSARVAKAEVSAGNIRHLVGYLDDDELRRLQNAHRFHLCPSETEGFGHYLVEAMSVGAVTITVDAVPMNELVQADRGLLVAASRTGTQGLATTHFFDEAAMEVAVVAALALDDAGIERYATAARAWYEANDAAFAPRLQAAVAALCADPVLP